MPTLGGYVSQEIYDKYDAIAKEKGISKSKLVGQAIITSKIVNTSEIENMELHKLREIQRIGANLNQIAKYCNIHKIIHHSLFLFFLELERFLGD